MPIVIGAKKAGTYKGFQIYKTSGGFYFGEKFFGPFTGRHKTKALLKRKIDQLENQGKIWF